MVVIFCLLRYLCLFSNYSFLSVHTDMLNLSVSAGSAVQLCLCVCVAEGWLCLWAFHTNTKMMSRLEEGYDWSVRESSSPWRHLCLEARIPDDYYKDLVILSGPILYQNTWG